MLDWDLNMSLKQTLIHKIIVPNMFKSNNYCNVVDVSMPVKEYMPMPIKEGIQ